MKIRIKKEKALHFATSFPIKLAASASAVAVLTFSMIAPSTSDGICHSFSIPAVITASAAAQLYAPNLNGSNYIVWKATSWTPVYAYSNLSARGNFTNLNGGGIKTYGSACIDAGDDCYIYRMWDSVSIVKYPAGSTYRFAYVRTSDITKGNRNETKNAFKAAVSVNTFTYNANGGTFRIGSISKNDTCYLLNKVNNAYQIVYPISGNNFKVGWVSAADYNRIVGSDSVISTSAFEYPLRNATCSWSGYNASTWSWSENSGIASKGNRVYHLGLDLRSTSGNKNVYACAKGTVVAFSNSTSGANGRYVIIKHNISGKTVYSFYAHLDTTNVWNGQSVDTNTKIGVMGGSGYGINNYYGTHLHFGITDTLWSNGGYWGYSTYFSGNTRVYDGVTYYNPKYVIENDRLP